MAKDQIPKLPEKTFLPEPKFAASVTPIIFGVIAPIIGVARVCARTDFLYREAGGIA